MMPDTFDNFISRAKEAAAAAGKVAEEVVDTSRLKIREAKLSSEIREAYERLGSVAYDSIKHNTDNRHLKDMVVAELDGLLQEMEDLKSGEASAAEQVACPQCGCFNEKSFTFCSRCGASLQPREQGK